MFPPAEMGEEGCLWISRILPAVELPKFMNLLGKPYWEWKPGLKPANLVADLGIS